MPDVPEDLLDRIHALEGEVRRLAGRAQIRPAMDEIADGNVTVSGGGRFQVQGRTGFMLHTGSVTPSYSDGSEQRGFLVNDDNEPESQPLAVFAQGVNAPGDPYADIQLLWMRDPAGNIVLRTDPRQGIARPYVPIPMYPSAVPQWPATTATTFTDMWEGEFPKQHAMIRCVALGWCNTAGATGEMRMLLNGTQVGATQPINNTSVAFGVWYEAVPGAHMNTTNLRVQARLASGGGSVVVRGFSAYGRE